MSGIPENDRGPELSAGGVGNIMSRLQVWTPGSPPETDGKASTNEMSLMHEHHQEKRAPRRGKHAQRAANEPQAQFNEANAGAEARSARAVCFPGRRNFWDNLQRRKKPKVGSLPLPSGKLTTFHRPKTTSREMGPRGAGAPGDGPGGLQMGVLR